MTRRQIFSLISFLSCSVLNAKAQIPDQVINLGILDYNSSCYTYADGSGNMYLVGHAYYPLDFDPGPDVVEAGPPDNQVFVVKYNSAFEILWLAHIEHATIVNADASFLTADGGIIISGSASSDPIIYGTGGSETLLLPNGLAAYYVQFDSDGAIISSQAIGGPNGSSSVYIEGISEDAFHHITIAGYYIGNVDFDPSAATYLLTGSLTDPYGYMAKYDESGNMLWVKKLGSGINQLSITDMTSDHDGNIILCGYFYYTVDFNPDPLITNNFTALDVLDGFIAKYNADGNYLWAGSLRESESFGSVHHVITDPADNIIIEGSFARKCDFDITAGIKNRKPSGADFYIAKYDPAGNYKWVKNPTGDGDFVISQIATDQEGNIYSTGQFSGVFDFDFGNTVFNMTGPDAAGYHTNLFVTRMDKKGSFDYAFQLSPVFAELTGHGAGSNLSVTADNKLLLTGTYDGSMDIDPTAGENIITETGYDHTGFVARYIQPVLRQAPPTPEIPFAIVPSPASGYFSVDCSQGEIENVAIVDMEGKLIKSWPGVQTAGSSGIFDISDIPSGSYLVKAFVNGKESARLIQITR